MGYALLHARRKIVLASGCGGHRPKKKYACMILQCGHDKCGFPFSRILVIKEAGLLFWSPVSVCRWLAGISPPVGQNYLWGCIYSKSLFVIAMDG